ncbi:MAG TPA: helix-turn-helix domain-containing protein, partial [Candidatus Pelethocola excrementipullorum]|nr:helix-turn-helix domain-containing protein [Candidatus Pelethocola excrementipullorum]
LIEQVLTEQEYKVLCMRYGLYGTEGLTQRAIAGKMGISRSYVSRIEKNAVLKLRSYFK